MPTQGWIEAPKTKEWFERFVAVMREMDPRYGPLTAEQVARWFVDTGPYARDRLTLFARAADTQQPTADTADMFCLTRIKANGDRGVLMLGWHTLQAVPSLVEINDIISLLLIEGRSWLNGNHVEIGCIVPRDMACLPMRMLHARIRERGLQSTPDPNNYLRIVVRPVDDAEYWRVYLF